MFPVLASVLLFIVILSYNIKKYDKVQDKELQEFWEKENKANFVRRKSLDNLPYIIIPENLLDENIPDDPKCHEALDMLLNLKNCRILNLTGISNTDLKLTYGTANISALTEYDQNYTFLARALTTLGETYYKEGNINKAKEYLEFAISTKTDISSTYKILGSIYKDDNNTAGIEKLKEVAGELHSAMAPAIIRYLSELNA